MIRDSNLIELTLTSIFKDISRYLVNLELKLEIALALNN